jgi:hypothetical protein
MANHRYLILCAVLLVVDAVGPGIAAAQEAAEASITLINGAVVRGRVTKCSEAGIEIVAGSSTRTLPWTALAPGSRYKYDVSFRVNASGYLSGEPQVALTNAPDTVYDPMNPATWTVADSVVPAATDTGLNFASFAPGKPVNIAGNPVLKSLPSPVHYWAMQVGPSERDVVLYGFPGNDASRMFHIQLSDGRMVTEAATARALGGVMFHSFPKKSFQTKFGDVDAGMDVQWLVETNESSRRFLQADVTLTRGSQQAVFVLQGTPPGIKAGTNAVTPRPLLVEPALAFTIQVENEIPFLVGQVRMSRLNMLPRSGMDLKAVIEIANDKGRLEMKQDVPFLADLPPGAYPLRVDLNRLSPGQSYKISATIFLGAFFGKLTHEELFVLPDATKL